MHFVIVIAMSHFLGAAYWSYLEESGKTVLPKILQTYSSDVFGRDQEKARQIRKSLGAYQVTAIPMYWRHLKDEPESPDIVRILTIVQQIGEAEVIFLPFARKKLSDKHFRSYMIGFISKFGRAQDAKAVSALLLEPEIDTDTIRLVLRCLAKIGGEPELAVLDIFINKALDLEPRSKWSVEVDPCRNAIKTRLASTVKKDVILK